jgi:hypothetical protein
MLSGGELLDYLTLKIKVQQSVRMLVATYCQLMHCNIPEDVNFQRVILQRFTSLLSHAYWL